MSDTVRKYLEAHLKWLGPRFPEEWLYKGIHGYLLEEGRAWEAAPLPADLIIPEEYRTKKECFRNALELALLYPGRLHYVEGYAHKIIPCAHAWCVDNDGRVVDPTWDLEGEEEYWGVAMEALWVMAQCVKSGHYGVLDDWGREWPIIRGVLQPAYVLDFRE